jgi:hypothetical protein
VRDELFAMHDELLAAASYAAASVGWMRAWCAGMLEPDGA